jgi:DDE family transposase
MSPLRWTCKSTRRLAKELCREGHPVSHTKVGHLLKELDYSLQATRKTREGASHPDRNAKFEHINARVKDFQQRGQPVVSVDTKKKERVGDFANGGHEYQPKGSPERVRVYDFIDKHLGKAIPYGVYDMTQNCGWVSVGVDHDTAEFAVATLQRWWQQMGQRMYPQAQQLLITADGGGSNGSRLRLWKVAVQKFSDATGLEITVCHFPPGTCSGSTTVGAGLANGGRFGLTLGDPDGLHRRLCKKEEALNQSRVTYNQNRSSFLEVGKCRDARASRDARVS